MHTKKDDFVLVKILYSNLKAYMAYFFTVYYLYVTGTKPERGSEFVTFLWTFFNAYSIELYLTNRRT